MSSVRHTHKHRPFKNLFIASPDDEQSRPEPPSPEEQPSNDEQPSRDERPKLYDQDEPRPARRWKWLAGVAVLLVLVVWLAPVLIAHSPMMGWIVSSASSDLDGSVEVGSASLGWFSPVCLSQVEIRDSQGQTVVSIPQVDGDRSLLSLAFDRSQLGKFRLDKPQLSVVLDDKGTNVQRLIAKYLEPSDDPASAVGVVIVDATVTIEDRTGGKKTAEKWKIEDLDLEFNKPIDGDMTLAATGSLPDGRQAAQFDVELTMPAAEDAMNSLTAATGSLPLKRFAGLLTALAPQSGLAGAELGGRLDAKIKCEWPNGDSPRGTTVSVDTAVKNLLFAGPQLSGDRLELENLLAIGDLTWGEDGFALETASVECDLGSVALKGNLRVDSTTAGTPAGKAADKNTASIESLGVLAPYARQSFKLEGNVDLARLANMLPNTLHIHKQTRVTSGKLTVALSSGKGPQGMVWKGRIETSDLTAMRRGHELVWQQPIVLTFHGHESDVGPMLEELKCRSTFLNMHVAGWRENLEASLNFDLDQLAQRLDGFVDFKGTQMQGNGWVNLDWKRDKQNTFELDADLQISKLLLSMGGRKPLSEDNITANINATGQTDFRQLFRLDTTEFEIRAGGEELQVSLASPVSRVSMEASWPLEINAQGQLGGWIERAKSWIVLDDVNLAGSYRLRARGTGSTEGVSLESCELNINNLYMIGYGLNMAEPQAKLSVAGQYDTATRRMLLKQVVLENPTLYARGDGIIFGMPQDKPMELAGDLSYRAELAGLQRWTADPKKPQAWRVDGRLSGKGRLKQIADVTNGTLEATIENLTAVDSSGQRFHEPNVRLVAGGVYENSKRLLTLQQLKLNSAAVGADLSGKVNGFAASSTAPANAQIDGRLNYNMEKLVALLRPYVGNGVHIFGSDSRPFSFAGPVSLTEGTAQAAVNWQQAYAYGFRMGPGELKLSLKDGTVQLAPTSLPVSNGQVNVGADLKLSPGPMTLDVKPGKLVQQVHIDPDMCAYGLQYVAPALAGVTSAQGQFSIDIEECRIPLDDPGAGKLKGKFTVHSVEIGPGPLVREIATVLVPGSSSAKLTRESVIPFELANRRIYHRDMELEFPGLTIRTRGSVGLDKTIYMEAEMPVPPSLLRGIRDERVLSATRGQTIKLPINGTLDRPQIDRRRLAEYTNQFARDAARNVIENEVNNQLNRLLRPRR